MALTVPDLVRPAGGAYLDWGKATAPAILYRPPWQTSVGRDVVKLAATAGLFLDLWQALALEEALGRTLPDAWADGSRWATPEVGLMLARQNGKDAILEALTLASLFLWRQSLVHSAHEMKTTKRAFARVQGLILQTPALRSRLLQPVRGRGITTGIGNEGIHLAPDEGSRDIVGPEAWYVARSGGSGRGFTVPLFIFNEAWRLTADAVAAQTPAQSTMPDPQTWYVSSPPDKTLPNTEAEVIGGLRERALAGHDPDLAWLEWTADPRALPGQDVSVAVAPNVRAAAAVRRHDEAAYARANPSYEIRRKDGTQGITAVFLHRQARGPMGGRKFDTEHLGIGDWPTSDDTQRWEVIARAVWEARSGAAPLAARPPVVVFGIAAAWPNAEEYSLGRCFAAGALAGAPAERVIEVVDRAPGTAWLVARCVAEQEQGGTVFLIDPGGPAGAAIPALKAAGVELVELTMREVAQAFGGFYAGMVTEPDIRHYDQPVLRDTVGGAQTRALGDGQTWARRGKIDVAPAESVTLAAYGHATRAHLAARAPIEETIW